MHTRARALLLLRTPTISQSIARTSETLLSAFLLMGLPPPVLATASTAIAALFSASAS
eukprot:CAMPEP_0182878894 /NCGR_PEP_ID=MMETSP0034_2-20130328/15629_1 /TAXON_ID=156128 /ORGANISM="Nephroselmis pyriformis, Strain CCMP717" /LENGTH=57 /DNA_ID=CAMNT_0025011793 /DNA_START=671 /DNA_END=841 /DNA_ORIENTATION=-